MAKDKTAAAAPAATGPQIKIKEVIFDVADKYAEGHTLTAVEASVLNQTRRENLRNNYAGAVVKAIEEAKKANTALDETTLKAAFATYAAEYTFGERKAAAVVDPTEKRARQIARGQLEAKIREKGHKVADYKEKIEGFISDLLDRDPAIRAEAKRQVEALKATAATSLDDILG